MIRYCWIVIRYQKQKAKVFISLTIPLYIISAQVDSAEIRVVKCK